MKKQMSDGLVDRLHRFAQRGLMAGVLLTLFAAGSGYGQETVAKVESPDVVENLFDPFSYHVQGEHGDAFIPADSSDMPKGIRVLAIMQASGGPPHAVLEIAGHADPVFVTEKDVVRVEKPERLRGTGKRKTGRAVRMGRSDEPVYLRIHSISRNSVEISPQKRPQEIHIFQ